MLSPEQIFDDRDEWRLLAEELSLLPGMTDTGRLGFAIQLKSSFLMILTDQAIPQKIEYDENGIPITYPCQTTYYILKNNQFSKIFEDKQGCC
ncbi:hypothetical protein ACGVWS_10305 [Enterobacteriaceae bacterium LUAb1]